MKRRVLLIIPGFLNQRSCCLDRYTKLKQINAGRNYSFDALLTDLQFGFTRELTGYSDNIILRQSVGKTILIGDRTDSPKFHRARTDFEGEAWE